MSEKFTASNGLSVALGPGRIDVTDDEGFGNTQYVGADGIDALREFFQHERDLELGRWRWPEDPNIVVYPRDGGGWVEVIHEVHASRGVYSRGDFNSVPEWVEDAAEAYFAAHPVRKPWHDAKPEEAWLLTMNGDEGVFLASRNYVDGGVVLTASNGTTVSSLDDEQITAGRRLWPEVDDGE